jgi:hypothetical protein
MASAFYAVIPSRFVLPPLAVPSHRMVNKLFLLDLLPLGTFLAQDRLSRRRALGMADALGLINRIGSADAVHGLRQSEGRVSSNRQVIGVARMVGPRLDYARRPPRFRVGIFDEDLIRPDSKTLVRQVDG